MKSSGEQAHVMSKATAAGTSSSGSCVKKVFGGCEVCTLVRIAFSGKSAIDYLTLAREQRGVGHMFNAAMLYSAASSLAFRGSNFRLGIWREIEADAKSLRLPTLLEGRPPYLWQFGSESSRVLHVRPFFAGGETNLTIRVELPSLNDVKVTEGLSHALIGHLTNAYLKIFGSFESNSR